MAKIESDHRELVAAFLERVADGEAEPGAWERLIVNHYVDEELERIRRDCVRLRMRNGSMRWSPDEQEQILTLVRQLRSGPTK